MYDSWTDTPAVDGAVLIGDAAGFSNPLIGQGSVVAMRDVRRVSDATAGDDDWSAAAFAPYTAERAERMRRLRFCVETFTDAHMPLGPRHDRGAPPPHAAADGRRRDLFMAERDCVRRPRLVPRPRSSPRCASASCRRRRDRRTPHAAADRDDDGSQPALPRAGAGRHGRRARTPATSTPSTSSRTRSTASG